MKRLSRTVGALAARALAQARCAAVHTDRGGSLLTVRQRSGMEEASGLGSDAAFSRSFDFHSDDYCPLKPPYDQQRRRG